jgi:hypothetical protein
MDIAGKVGDPVLAAAAGVVSYAGAGLRGYGNLVVLRHNANLLSVYAHNSKLLVKEKDTVAKGTENRRDRQQRCRQPAAAFRDPPPGQAGDPQKFLPPRADAMSATASVRPDEDADSGLKPRTPASSRTSPRFICTRSASRRC